MFVQVNFNRFFFLDHIQMNKVFTYNLYCRLTNNVDILDLCASAQGNVFHTLAHFIPVVDSVGHSYRGALKFVACPAVCGPKLIRQRSGRHIECLCF
jgi:hypothetical protein